MIKLLPVGLVVILVVGGLIYFRVFKSAGLQAPQNLIVEIPKSDPTATDKERIATLEESVKLLASEIGKINQSLNLSKNQEVINTTSPLTDTKIKNLETKTLDLQSQINSLKSSSTSQSTTTSTSKSPAYIPLGSSDTANDRNFLSLNTYQVQIDPADYSGYSGMQLEVNLKMSEAVGTANVRLYNSTDSSTVASSQVSTTSTQYTWLTSSSFKLSSGKKTYTLQVQSTEGYTVYLQSARLKVNF